jgi:ATP-dependent Clp protease ATP-binding subunit ClpA
MGARPLARKIDELVRVPLSKKILFNKLKNVNIMAMMNGKMIEFRTAHKAKVSIGTDGIIEVDSSNPTLP